MYRVLQEHHVSIPMSIEVDSEDEVLDAGNAMFPLIVKPSDSSGSRGVTRVDTPGELSVAITRARAVSPTTRAVVQEFVSGQEVSVEGFCIGESVDRALITDRSPPALRTL